MNAPAKTFRERIHDAAFGDITERRIQEAVEALRAASGRSGDRDDGWTRLTDSSSQRDLAPLTHDRQREIAVYLWTYNPLAHRIIEAIVEWVVGEGVQLQATEERTQQVLDAFWKDPINRWPQRLPEKVRELSLMGEQFWPAFTNPHSGLIKLGVMDPSRVKAVVLDPDNALIPIGIVTKKTASGQPERRYRTIVSAHEQEILSTSALAERERFDDGELFGFMVNKLSTQSRGISELFALADWLDGYEQLLFAQLSQERIRSMMLWDVTMTGASKEEIEEKARDIKPPKPFGVRVHNEKEEWKIVGPDAAAANSTDVMSRVFRNQVLGGAAIPEHWYGGGGDVNRATAAEMGGPTEKAMSARQRGVKWILTDVLSVQVERAIDAGTLPDAEEFRAFEVVFHELSNRDTSRLASSLQQVAGGLTIAMRQGLVDQSTAAKVMSSLISGFGVEANAEEMLERAKGEIATTYAEEAARALGRTLGKQDEEAAA